MSVLFKKDIETIEDWNELTMSSKISLAFEGRGKFTYHDVVDLVDCTKEQARSAVKSMVYHCPSSYDVKNHGKIKGRVGYIWLMEVIKVEKHVHVVAPERAAKVKATAAAKRKRPKPNYSPVMKLALGLTMTMDM